HLSYTVHCGKRPNINCPEDVALDCCSDAETQQEILAGLDSRHDVRAIARMHPDELSGWGLARGPNRILILVADLGPGGPRAEADHGSREKPNFHCLILLIGSRPPTQMGERCLKPIAISRPRM